MKTRERTSERASERERKREKERERRVVVGGQEGSRGWAAGGVGGRETESLDMCLHT